MLLQRMRHFRTENYQVCFITKNRVVQVHPNTGKICTEQRQHYFPRLTRTGVTLKDWVRSLWEKNTSPIKNIIFHHCIHQFPMTTISFSSVHIITSLKSNLCTNRIYSAQQEKKKDQFACKKQKCTAPRCICDENIPVIGPTYLEVCALRHHCQSQSCCHESTTVAVKNVLRRVKNRVKVCLQCVGSPA